MIREIKFRGKRIDNGQWIYGYLLVDDISDKYYIFANGNCCNETDNIGEENLLHILTFEVDKDTIGQYTGLKDKNGKEIYEGDIISNGYEKSIVVWIKEQAGFMLKLTNEEYADEEWTNPMIDLRKDDEVIRKYI